MWPDNRIARDAHYLYRYDRHGRLTEKTDLIPEGVIRTDDERTHRYHYDSQHRLVHYTRTQYAEPLVESRYLYDPLGRRVANYTPVPPLENLTLRQRITDKYLANLVTSVNSN